jgi:hypothetical protein
MIRAMTRETRINLIATAVILALMAPGGVLMFRKKMRPGARAILGQPDPVRRVVPYMEPQDLPLHERVVPPRTWSWVTEIARESGLREAMTMDTRPVMSGGRGIQVLGVDGDRLVMLLWDWRAGELAVGEEGASARVMSTREMELPSVVRKELQDAGYIDPPRRVATLEARLDPLRTTEPKRIYVRQKGGKGDSEEIVTLFTNPGDTNK